MSGQESNAANENGKNKQQPFLSHLAELRERLLKSIYCVLIVFICLFYFANDIYHWLATPLLSQLPDNSTMIATEVASPFFAPLKLTLFVSLIISVPYLLFQAWSFIAPGLYEAERKFALPLLIASFLLFYLGMVFAYFIVFPLLFAFFSATAPEGVSIMTDITLYLDFVLKILFAFGLAFEVPVATFLVIWSGIKTIEELESKRPYIFISAFVVGMLLTPPDIISQVLLAIPIWLLFEAGLLMAKYLLPENVSTN